MSEFDHRQPAESDYRARDRRVLVSTGFVMLFALLVASFLPGAVVVPAFSSFLFYAAFGGLLVAVLHGETWRARHLTGWDQAAILMAVALFVGFFADQEAAREYLSERAQSPMPNEG